MSALVVPRFFPVPVAVSWRAFHEAGHTAAASALGVVVDSASIHEHGGSTWLLGGSARERLLVALAGNAAEGLFDVRDSDIRCSSDDVRKAFLCGIEVARDEEHEYGGEGGQKGGQEGGQKPVPVGPRLLNPTSAVLASLTALDVVGVERNASRVAGLLAARWLARAEKLVALAEAEVYGILNTNRRLCRRIAAALEEHGHLDAAEIGAFIEDDDNRRKEA